MSKETTLTETLEIIARNTKGNDVDMGELVKALNSRGYAPLMVMPSVLIILPTGAIPGMPAICALMIIFVSVQILMRRSYPWMPEKFKKASFDREILLKGIDKAKPYTRKIDRYIYPRFSLLIQDAFKPLIAVICIVLSLVTIAFGFIPFLPIVPAVAVLFMGLGMMSRDGLLFLVAIVISLCSLAALPFVISKVLSSSSVL